MKRITKKSEIQTQIFVYVLAIIVIALVLLYGYNAINGFITTSKVVNLVQFKTDLSASLESQSHDYRSVVKKQLQLPSGFTKMIIVDLNMPADTNLTDYRILYDSWNGNVEKNIFLVGKSSTESFYAGKIYFSPGQSYVEIDAPDRIVELKLTGMGGSTKVEKWD